MKSSMSLAVLSLVTVGLGACTGTQTSAPDDRLAPELSEAEKEVIKEQGTDGETVHEKVVMYNSQVNQKDQVICKKEWVTGTRLTEIRCRTAEERRIAEEEAWNFIRRTREMGNCQPGSCGRGGEPVGGGARGGGARGGGGGGRQ